MKWSVLLVLVLIGGVNALEVLSYASMETEYEDMELLVETSWYKVPAMDVIEASVTLIEPADSSFCPVFFLRYPDGETTDTALRPLEDEEPCLGEVDTITVKFWIWCHDWGGWSIFMFTEENVFERIGRTKLDYPVGDWAVIVVDRETDTVVAELPLYVAIFKPTGKPPENLTTKVN